MHCAIVIKLHTLLTPSAEAIAHYEVISQTLHTVRQSPFPLYTLAHSKTETKAKLY